MEGKYSLKHLYNKGKSSQMKPQEFIDLMRWLDENANGQIDEAVEVTEKIDGSSNFIGYDGRIYVEKFGFDKKFYDESDFDNNVYEAKAKALLDYAHSLPDLEDYLEDLCNENNCTSVKLQIEVLMTKFTKDPAYCQIVLVPYQLDKLGKDGNGFIIQVLNGDTLQPVDGEKEAIITLCDIMSTDNFKVTGTNPKKFEPIDIKEDIQQVKDIIATYTEKMGKSVEEILTSRKRADSEMKKALKAEIEEVQEALQDKLTEAFPAGDYGDYYEGLVFKLTNGMMFKVTSKKFKQFIAEHNHWTESTELPVTENEDDKKEKEKLAFAQNIKIGDKNTTLASHNKSFIGVAEADQLLSELFKSESNDNLNTLQIAFSGNTSGIFLAHGKSNKDKVSLHKVSDFNISIIKILEKNLGLTHNSAAEFETLGKTFGEMFDLEAKGDAVNGTRLLNSEGNVEAIVIDPHLSRDTATIILKRDKNFIYFRVQETGGKQSNVYYSLDGKTLQITKGGRVKVNGVTDTNIQECVAGILIYDKLTNNENLLATDEDALIGKAFKDYQINDTFKTISFGNNKYQFNSQDDEDFTAAMNNALSSEWKTSMQTISGLNNFHLEIPIHQALLVHPSLHLVGDEAGKTASYDRLCDILFTKNYLDSKAYRDEVNPSDIYIVDGSQLDKIIAFFESSELITDQNILGCISTLAKEKYSAKETVQKALEAFKAARKDSWDEINSRRNSAKKDEKLANFEYLTKLLQKNDLASKLINELYSSNEIQVLAKNFEGKVPNCIGYAILHNFLTQHGYIAGISLKKVTTTAHFSFTGGDHFFELDPGSASSMLSRSKLKFGPEMKYCTIKNVRLTLGNPESSENLDFNSQGGLKIECSADKEDLGLLMKKVPEAKYDLNLIHNLIQEGNPLILNGLANGIIFQESEGSPTDTFDIDMTDFKSAEEENKNIIKLYSTKQQNEFLPYNGCEKISLDVRTNGSGVVVESGLGYSAAQGGKGTHALSRLIELETIAIDNPNREYSLTSDEALAIGLTTSDDTKAFSLKEKLLAKEKVMMQYLFDKDIKLSDSALDTFMRSLAYPKDTQFKLTLLFAKALKYQVFIEGKYQDVSIDHGSTLKNHFKYNFNLATVAYYKLS